MGPAIGRSVGNYRIISTLGSGGMGSVYLAEHQRIERQVALKVLHPKLAARQEMIERFFNEALATNRIRHPGIVDIYDCGVDDRVGAYLVMEYLKGDTLESLLRASELEVTEAVEIVEQIAQALAAAHASRIVHRDLKPGNVFLTDSTASDGGRADGPRIKIVDFGVAKLVEGAPQGVYTQAGEVFGTPRYMSPEQFHDARSVDHRTDIYSLGLIAYRLLCGRGPYDHINGPALMHAQLFEMPSAPTAHNPTLPQAVDRVLLKAIAKKPSERFDSIEFFSGALREALGIAAIPQPELGIDEATSPAVSVDESTAVVARPSPPASMTPTPMRRPRGGAVLDAPTAESFVEGAVPPHAVDTGMTPTVALALSQMSTPDSPTARTRVREVPHPETVRSPAPRPPSAPIASPPRRPPLAQPPPIPPPTLASFGAAPGRSHARRRQAAMVAGAAVALVAMALGIWLATSGSDDDPSLQHPTAGRRAAAPEDASAPIAVAVDPSDDAGTPCDPDSPDCDHPDEPDPPDAAAIVARPTPRRLWLTTDPSGARVIAGDKVVGFTPLADVPIDSMVEQLKIEKEGYARHILALGGESSELRYEEVRLQRLTRRRAPSPGPRRHPKPRRTPPAKAAVSTSTATLSVVTLDGGKMITTDIYIDGKRVGQTPLYLERQRPALHRVTARLPGYRIESRMVRLVPGRVRKMVFKLQRAR